MRHVEAHFVRFTVSHDHRLLIGTLPAPFGDHLLTLKGHRILEMIGYHVSMTFQIQLLIKPNIKNKIISVRIKFHSATM